MNSEPSILFQQTELGKSLGVRPIYATEGSSAFDLQAIGVAQKNGDTIINFNSDQYYVNIFPGDYVSFRTGLKIWLGSGGADKHLVGLIFARSGLGTKHGLVPRNCVGVIDSDYQGEILVTLVNSGRDTQTVKFGDRIAQMLITEAIIPKFDLVDEWPETERGSGGHGSTGK